MTVGGGLAEGEPSLPPSDEESKESFLSGRGGEMEGGREAERERER